MVRINENSKYFYSYPSLNLVENDCYGDKLTNGKNTDWIFAKIKNETFESGSWRGAVTVTVFDKYKEPHFFIQNDFGLLSDVKKAEIKFSKKETLPQKVELYFSNDGYNYTIFPDIDGKIIGNEDFVTYSFDYENPIKAKGVKIMVFGELDKVIAFSDLCVYSEKDESKTILLSEGIDYNWQGGETEAFNKKIDLTVASPAKYDASEDKFEARYATLNHPVSGSSVSVLTADLGEEKNICEVMIDGFSSPKFETVPYYITVEYSLDGENYEDFGQGYQQGHFGTEEKHTLRYIVTRNHTVKARYIKIYITGHAAISRFGIYGSEKEIAEIEYDHIIRKEHISHTNVLENKEVIVNGKATYRLTDNIFSHGEFDLEEKENEIICDIGEVKKDINSVMLYFIKKNGFVLPDTIKTYLSTDGKNFELMDGEYLSHTTGWNTVYRLYFKNKEARYIKFVVSAEKFASLLQIATYEKQPQLPLYRGAFFQLWTMAEQSEIPVTKNSEYMWYMQMKGMKDIGMDYIILSGVNLPSKRMTYSSPALIEKGFKLGEGYGTKEPLEVVLKIAEKLGIKVFLATVETLPQYSAILENGGFDHIKEEVEIAKLFIKDLYDRFNKYKSFVGYYFTDETCDEWLNARRGVELYRAIYAPQAELIRKLDKTKKTIISPAIWRSGSPAEGEKNLYELIKPLEEGGRPVIDIVAAQDCLGREETLYVPNSAYKDYEEHAEAWLKGVRKAGADFWIDAEVFEVIYYTKRYGDNVHSMEMHAKYTNGIIIFDYPHYFCELTKKNSNDKSSFNTSYVISQYAKRYWKYYKELDKIGME